MPSTINILIVDDHPVVRAGLAAALGRDPALFICGEAETVDEALREIAAHKPALVLADLDLENSSGLDLIKKIRETEPDIRVLVLSMHDESLYAERALRAGASGYVMKHQPPEILIAAIHSVMQGKIAVSERISSRLLQQYSGRKNDKETGPLDALTDRELEIFRLIGQGTGTRRIAEQLSVSVKTVEAHIAHIKQKLRISTGTELQHRAFQLGGGSKPDKTQVE
jgi:DNA-binding NarL/FixJ family response regulator